MPKLSKAPTTPYVVPAHHDQPDKQWAVRRLMRRLVHQDRRCIYDAKGKLVRQGRRSKERHEYAASMVKLMKEEASEVALAYLNPRRLRLALYDAITRSSSQGGTSSIYAIRLHRDQLAALIASGNLNYTA